MEKTMVLFETLFNGLNTAGNEAYLHFSDSEAHSTIISGSLVIINKKS